MAYTNTSAYYTACAFLEKKNIGFGIASILYVVEFDLKFFKFFEEFFISVHKRYSSLYVYRLYSSLYLYRKV